MEQDLGPSPTAAQLRACDKNYALALAVQERIRTHVIETKASKLFLGEEQFDLFAQRLGLLRHLLEVEPNLDDLHSAFTTAELGKARVFLEQMARSRAEVVGQVGAELRREEADIVDELHEIDGHITQEEQKPPNQRDSKSISSLFAERMRTEERLQRLVARMEQECPQYAALNYPKPCSLEDARACLGENEAALIYVLGTTVSHVLLLEGKADKNDGGVGLTIYSLPSAKEISEQVAALVDPDALERSARVQALGADGYRMLLAPLADKIKGKDLVVVPDGELSYLPFELLVEGADDSSPGHYLIENHRIRYAPSLTVLHLVQQWDKTRIRPDRTLWALGDPIYEPDDERIRGKKDVAQATQDALREYASRAFRGSENSLKYQRLRFSGRELQEIRDIEGASSDDILTGLLASEAAVKAASQKGVLAHYRYIHFATHGILGLDVGRQPSLVLNLIGNDGKKDEYGANDGFLQLDVVTQLKLNADLVVLSACESGRGRLYNGEGVTGLARAFLYAGSRAVLCSLWSVDDQETANLMADVYRQLKAGKSSPEALRQAQLKMIRAGKAPLYWAPFILIGD
jgi:CHAT domain-containing protein